MTEMFSHQPNIIKNTLIPSLDECKSFIHVGIKSFLVLNEQFQCKTPVQVNDILHLNDTDVVLTRFHVQWVVSRF